MNSALFNFDRMENLCKKNLCFFYNKTPLPLLEKNMSPAGRTLNIKVLNLKGVVADEIPALLNILAH